MVAGIEMRGVGAVQALHSARERRLAALDDQVEVVPHQANGPGWRWLPSGGGKRLISRDFGLPPLVEWLNRAEGVSEGLGTDWARAFARIPHAAERGLGFVAMLTTSRAREFS